MPECLVGLGSNLGDRAAQLTRAVDALAGTSGIERVQASRFVETPPLGGPAGQPGYLNAAVRFSATLSPQASWQLLSQIERDAGRCRETRWGPRTLDLDLLLYGDSILRTPELTVPHPRMVFRDFVLEPAVQIAPELIHPQLGGTLAQLREHLSTAWPYLAIAGLPPTGKRELATALADRDALARQLDPADWPQPKRPAVSDYWLDEYALAVAAGNHTNESPALPTTHPLQPKLLLVLTAPADWLRARTSPGEPWHDRALIDDCQQRLLGAARACRRPILELDASRPAELLAEAQAALTAIA